MSFFDIVKDIGEQIATMVRESVKLKSLSKSDILTIINTNLDTHKIIEVAKKQTTPTEISKCIERYNDNTLHSNDKHHKILEQIVSRYGKASQRVMGSGHDLTPLFNANKKFIKVLTQMGKNIDKLIVDKELTVFNTRVSHAAMLGILKQSEMYGRYLSFIWSHVIIYSTNPEHRPHLGRVKYMLDNLDDFIEATNLINEKTGRYSFLNEVDNIKQKQANLLLYANGVSLASIINPRNYNLTIQSSLKHGLGFLPIFSLPVRVWDDLQRTNYLRNESMKSWLEEHVAILQMDQMNTDPDSPEYRKREKSIQFYSDQISRYDKKIKGYLEED